MWPAKAQTYENGLLTESVNPKADAAVIARMQERMDSIHRSQQRPTVALVLSGGGAKGAAHVGVLRYLEEQQIPIDMVCGTSMGGLVGGLISLGYDSRFLDSLLRHQDWSVMLTDRIDPSYYPYNRKLYRETYLMSIPFHYSKKDFQTRIDDQVRYIEDGRRGPVGQNTFMSSLPSGFAYGFNVNNTFSSLSVGYQDHIDFTQLPIPFFCVAADVISLKAKNWSSGSLKDAMRSTMSIPGLFKPVRTRGMVLVDGGVQNNFPVDIARAMGADIVIGVDLSDADPSYSQVNNVGDIMMQFITMLGKSSFDRNKNSTDVFIKPHLDGYNMLSFSTEAIDTIINRGYRAACEVADSIAVVKEQMKGAEPYLSAPKAVDIGSTPVKIYGVEFAGLTNPESRFLQRKIGFKVGSTVDKKEMERMMSIIEATGCFSSVTYDILGREEPYRLIFNCVKGPRHQFGMGVRFDTEEWPAFLFNVGLNAHKLSGAKLDVNAKVGRNQYLAVRGALDLAWLPTINLEASVMNVSSTLITDLARVGSEARWWGHSEKLYFSNIKWTNVDVKLGAQYRRYILPYSTSYGEKINVAYPQLASGGYLGAFVNGTIYTYDTNYYPSKGMKMTFGYDLDFMKRDCPGFKPLHQPFLNFASVIPFGGRVALIPDIHMRVVLGNADEPDPLRVTDPNYSFAHQNYVGGMMADRYIERQIPFIGFNNVYQADPYVVVANLGLRVQPAKNLFLTATGGYFREAKTIKDMVSTVLPTLWGAGFEIGYRTPVGPVKVVGTWSERFHNFEKDAGLYISLGFDF